jgi:hypothetical protein
MQSKLQVIKRCLGKRYFVIKDINNYNGEIGIVSSIIDENTVRISYRNEAAENVSIFNLRNPDQEF